MKIRLWITALLFVISCKKEEIAISYSDLGAISSYSIHQIHITSSGIWYAACGKTDAGEIKISLNQGQTWTTALNAPKEIYDVEMVSSTQGYACGQDMTLYFTNNTGNTWQPYVFPFLPVEHERVHFKDIFFLDSLNGIICGGKNYNNGSLIRFKKGGFVWNFTHFDRELGAVWMHDKKKSAISGYGGLYTSADSSNSYSICNFAGDNYVAMHFTDVSTGFSCGYDGGIYKTTDGGSTWSTVLKNNSGISARKHFNDIFFLNSTTGFAVGNNGCIVRTTDGGNNWEKLNEPSDSHLLSISYSAAGNIVVLSAYNGHVYTFAP